MNYLGTVCRDAIGARRGASVTRLGLRLEKLEAEPLGNYDDRQSVPCAVGLRETSLTPKEVGMVASQEGELVDSGLSKVVSLKGSRDEQVQNPLPAPDAAVEQQEMAIPSRRPPKEKLHPARGIPIDHQPQQAPSGKDFRGKAKGQGDSLHRGFNVTILERPSTAAQKPVVNFAQSHSAKPTAGESPTSPDSKERRQEATLSVGQELSQESVFPDSEGAAPSSALQGDTERGGRDHDSDAKPQRSEALSRKAEPDKGSLIPNGQEGLPLEPILTRLEPQAVIEPLLPTRAAEPQSGLPQPQVYIGQVTVVVRESEKQSPAPAAPSSSSQLLSRRAIRRI